MKSDYEKMWNELKVAITKSGICGIDRRLQITLHDLDALEEKHTPWKPKVGEWVWCPTCEKPVMYPGSSFGSCEGHKFENVEPHLPILEYKGFKVGERVRDDAGNEFTIDSFVLQPNEEASVHSGYGITIPIYKLRHLPPPEPDEYVTHCTAGRSVRVQKGKGINVIHIEYVDARIGDCITLRYEEVDEVIEYLQKLKKKLEV